MYGASSLVVNVLTCHVKPGFGSQLDSIFLNCTAVEMIYIIVMPARTTAELMKTKNRQNEPKQNKALQI